MFFQSLLDEFTITCKQMIRNDLTGVYLHGSLAMNCFNPAKSDIDILVVIDHEMEDTVKMSFMNKVIELNEKANTKGLEISIIQRVYCKPFVYPTPFELHFSASHLKWFKDDPNGYIKYMKGEDKDLAAHITIINTYGNVLFGEDITNVFGQVRYEDYIDSIWFDIKNAKEEITDNPIYIILNLCRVLAYHQERMVLSKEQGGKWGLIHCSNRFHEIISLAITSYTTEQENTFNDKDIEEFVDYMLDSIKSKKEEIEEFC